MQGVQFTPCFVNKNLDCLKTRMAESLWISKQTIGTTPNLFLLCAEGHYLVHQDYEDYELGQKLSVEGVVKPRNSQLKRGG